MNFLISIIVTIFIIFVGRRFIKKHSKLCYGISIIISLALVIASYSGSLSNLPPFINDYILPLFTKSAFATSIFVIVMYTGALKNGSKLMKILMPIRAELSIIASILTLAHNIIFGRYHFVTLFTNPKSMSLNMLIAAIISVILIVIMVPLMITSFPSIRKKMKYKSWKKLQRFAYVFYSLIYIHIMLIMLPLAKSGNSQYILNVLIYSLVFLTYAIMRINKALNKKYSNKLKTNINYFAALIVFACICLYIFYPATKENNITTSNENNSNTLEETPTSTEEKNTSTDTTSYKDGTYEGTGSGFNGNISVKVTIESNSITNIVVTDTVDDEPFIDKAINGIFEAVIEVQSTEVDTVSGATFSSKGLISAVKDALKDAQN
ncbi:FMN-binding protein [Clostridium sp. D53t1_180928_C8]|uniref:FMN-binding protein n=1 Tax=Clostridium sp. D53t1_180928_C8 TaxID=2787101 RepID=UPI0018A8CEBC|nr:FMN-binding protein [Clostridium sp. D53t1_180928_C8]